MARIIVCDWIPPAFGAVGQYMDIRARSAAATGERVVLIGLGEQGQVDSEGALTTVRLAARNPGKTAPLMRRAQWAFNTSRRLIAETHRAVGSLEGAPAEITVTGSPPFLSYLMIIANAFVWRRTLVYRITDFYPETLFAAGHFRAFGFVQGFFHALRRGADRIEALGEDQRRRLMESGVPEDRIVVVRDASPIDDWSMKPATSPFAKGTVTLLYSGNLGVAHDLDTFCAGYEKHHREGSGRVRLWLNGQGAQVGTLADYCRDRDLPLHLTPPSALEDLPGILLAADVHLVLLKDAFWGYVLPSKIYACLATKAPILYVGPAQSDIHLLGAERGGYVRVSPGDALACAAALEAIADEILPQAKRRGG